LRLVFPNKINYESFIIAQKLGYFAKESNNVEIQTVNSGIQAAEAMNTGSCDIIATGNGPAVILMSKSKDNVIVCRYATGEKMHRLIADTSLHNINDLKGKRIGVQQGSSTHATLLAWLEKNTVSVDSIVLIPITPQDMPEAMKNKQLDAIAGSEPWAINVEKICGEAIHEFERFYDSENSQSHVVITTRRIVDKYRKEIQQLCMCIEKANAFLRNNPEKSAEIVSKQLGLSVEEQMKCTSRLNWQLGWDNGDVKSMEETAKSFFAMKKIIAIPDIDNHLKIIIKNK
jgi:ABC-type nitrate/sulfonate/bicarbonate transport system substrate-binding protein